MCSLTCSLSMRSKDYFYTELQCRPTLSLEPLRNHACLEIVHDCALLETALPLCESTDSPLDLINLRGEAQETEREDLAPLSLLLSEHHISYYTYVLTFVFFCVYVGYLSQRKLQQLHLLNCQFECHLN